jgi:hypothetical protein
MDNNHLPPPNLNPENQTAMNSETETSVSTGVTPQHPVLSRTPSAALAPNPLVTGPPPIIGRRVPARFTTSENANSPPAVGYMPGTSLALPPDTELTTNQFPADLGLTGIPIQPQENPTVILDPVRNSGDISASLAQTVRTIPDGTEGNGSSGSLRVASKKLGSISCSRLVDPVVDIRVFDGKPCDFWNITLWSAAGSLVTHFIWSYFSGKKKNASTSL